jgi:hypothetical protein
MKKHPKPWERYLWGVEFTIWDKREPPRLIGALWNNYPPRPSHDGEPSRALLFVTRRQARAWCAEKNKQYAGRADCCRHWRFQPVRVVETVRKVRDCK